MRTPKETRMGIRIEDMEVPCVVGIYKRERLEPQPLRFSIEATYPGHVSDSETAPFFDYAALGLAVTFVCQSAQFLLLEDVVTATDDLVWSMLPEHWRGRASVSVAVKKPQALTTFGAPVVFAQNDAPRGTSMRSETGLGRRACLTRWSQGGLHYLDGDRPIALNDLPEGAQLLVTAGGLSEDEDAHAWRAGHVLSVTSGGAVTLYPSKAGVTGGLLYLPNAEPPKVDATSGSNPAAELIEGENLFAALGIPEDAVLPFSELIWGAAPRRRLEASPQNEWRGTDVDPAAPSPFPSKRAPSR